MKRNKNKIQVMGMKIFRNHGGKTRLERINIKCFEAMGFKIC
jgi:hypothetical protein